MSLVHRLVTARPGRPTLLALHGRGGREEDLLGLAGALDGAGVLAPRGPEPQPSGYAWFRHHRVGVPVAESLDLRLAEVAGWLEEVVRREGLIAPLPAVGFSNGGMMAGALASARPDLVGDVALLSSAYPLPEEVLALGGLRGRRVLASGGEDDPFLPADVAAAGVEAYRRAGAEVTARWHPGGHGIREEEVRDLARWLG
jgi:phospholipase/carboxylesterase